MDGIIAFTNVPSYAQARQSYLDLAAACTLSAQETNAEFLLQKTLANGIKHYLIGPTSGENAHILAAQTDMTCPGYTKAYDEVSSILEMVALSVATTLDATILMTKDEHSRDSTSRNLLTDAVRLDHFHAHESPSLHDRRLQKGSSVFFSNSYEEVPLEMRTEQGLFLVSATPGYFTLEHNSTKAILESAHQVDNANSGLFIQRQNGQIVRLILKPDQVTIMVGTGYNKWVDRSKELPAVPHAMIMPTASNTAMHHLLRTWFGRTLLLPTSQRMLKSIDLEKTMNTMLYTDKKRLGSKRHLVEKGHCQYLYYIDPQCQLVCNIYINSHQTSEPRIQIDAIFFAWSLAIRARYHKTVTTRRCHS